MHRVRARDRDPSALSVGHLHFVSIVGKSPLSRSLSSSLLAASFSARAVGKGGRKDEKKRGAGFAMGKLFPPARLLGYLLGDSF